MDRRFFVYKCVGWSVPAIILCATLLTAGPKTYASLSIQGTRVCWLERETLYAAFLAPLCVCTLLNIFFFVFVQRAIIESGVKRKKSTGLVKKQSKMQELRAGVSMFTVCGLSWGLGALIPEFISDSDSSLAMQYLFSLSTTLQGVAIYFFQCRWSAPVKLARVNSIKRQQKKRIYSRKKNETAKAKASAKEKARQQQPKVFIGTSNTAKSFVSTTKVSKVISEVSVPESELIHSGHNSNSKMSNEMCALGPPFDKNIMPSAFESGSTTEKHLLLSLFDDLNEERLARNLKIDCVHDTVHILSDGSASKSLIYLDSCAVMHVEEENIAIARADDSPRLEFDDAEFAVHARAIVFDEKNSGHPDFDIIVDKCISWV